MNIGQENKVRVVRLAGCFMNAVIISLLAAFTLRIAAVNSKIDYLQQSTLSEQYCSELCPRNPIQKDEKCCLNSQDLCLHGILKADCWANLLLQKENEVTRLQESFYGLSVIGFAFLSIECLWIPCFSWLSSKKREGSKWTKADGICTFEGSISSKSSFSSLDDPLNPKQTFYHEDDSCPVCLQTIQDQRVSKLECRHFVHYSCSKNKCPICHPPD